MKSINNRFTGHGLFFLAISLLLAMGEACFAQDYGQGCAVYSDRSSIYRDVGSASLTASVTHPDPFWAWDPPSYSWSSSGGSLSSGGSTATFTSPNLGTFTITCTVRFDYFEGYGEYLEASGSVTVDVIQSDGSYTLQWRDNSLSQGRKLSLSGMPIPDVAEHQEGESDYRPEETHVDALNLDLSYAVTDVFVPTGTEQLALEVRRNLSQESWNTNSLPLDRQFNKPFGPCWNSSLCPSVHLSIDWGQDEGYRALFEVTDHMGRSYVFRSRWDAGLWGGFDTRDYEMLKFPGTTESGLSMEHVEFDYSTATGGVLRLPNGTVLEYGGIDTNTTTILPALSVLEDDRTHAFARMAKATDRYGNSLSYSYDLSGSDPAIRSIPTDIVSSLDPSLAISITQSNGLVTGIEDPRGNQIHYRYNADNMLYEVERANGGITVFTYETTTESSTNDVLYPTKFLYPTDSHHWTIESITDANSNTYAFAYTNAVRYTYRSWANGNRLYSIGNPRVLTDITRPDTSTVQFTDTGALGSTGNEQVESDKGTGIRQNTVTDANGNTWRYTFSDPAMCYPFTGTEAEIKLFEYRTLEIAQLDSTNAVTGSETHRFNRMEGYETEDSKLQIVAASSNTTWSGRTTTYAYDYDPVNAPSAKPYSETNALGGVKSYTYIDQFGYQIASATDELGRKTAYGFDEHGNRTAQTNFVANSSSVLGITRMEYGNTNLPNFMTLQTVVDLGNPADPAWVGDMQTEFVPHLYGKVGQRIVDPDDLALTTTYDYDLNNNLISTIDPNGNRVTNRYDSLNRLTEIHFFEGISTLKSTTKFWYDQRGNKTWEKDKNNHFTFFQYDEFNNLTNSVRIMDGISSPASGYTPSSNDIATAAEYNVDGTLFATVDARGLRTEFEYDDLRRLTNSIVDPGGLAYQTGYEYTGHCGSLTLPPYKFMPTKVTDPRGYTTETTYDALNRPTEIKAEVSNGVYEIISTMGYDKVGNLIHTTNWLNSSQSLLDAQFVDTAYDGLDRPVAVTNSIDYWTRPVVEIRYTSTGLQWKTIDELDRESEVEYDSAGRSVKTISPQLADGSHAETESRYDKNSNVVWFKDANENTTSNVYDHANRLVKTIAPEVWDEETQQATHLVAVTTYDAVGNVTSILDARQNLTTNFYDAANRLTKSILPAIPVFGGGTTQPETAMEYDKNSNPRFITDANEVVVEMQYDVLNRLTNTIDGELHSIGYRYDESGNRTKISDQNTNETQFEYDGLGRNTKIVYPDLSEETFEYDLVGNRIKRTDGIGQITKYEHDGRNRLKASYPNNYIPSSGTYDRAEHESAQKREYAYDLWGNLETVTVYSRTRAGFTSSVPLADVAYAYDALNRATNETSVGITHHYTYDLAGNRTNALYGVTGRKIEWEYDALNRIKEIHDEQGYTGTVNVSGGGSALQSAIDSATDGSLILVADGTYDPITIDKPVTVQSANGSHVSRIQSSGTGRCATLSNNARLIGFELSGGNIVNTNGAGAWVGKGCLIADCIVSNNVASGINAFGGGLFLQTGATAQNCLIANNSALNGGGIFCEKGGIVRNCTIENNTAESIGGGGVFMEEGGWMANSIVEGNVTTNTYARGGGGLFFYNPGGKVNSSTISSNLCVVNGGIGTRRSEFKDRRPLGEITHSILWNNTPSATSEEWIGTGNVYVDPTTVTSARGADLSVGSYASQAARTTSFKYDLNSNLMKRVLPNTVSEYRDFDALNRGLSFEVFDPSVSSVYSVVYKHDAVGNLRQMTDSVSGLHTIPQSVVYDWTYDESYRLLSENVDESSGSFVKRTEFDWDPAGNRTAMRKYSDGSLASTTYYDPASSLNQMVGWWSGNTNAVYLYDTNGNRTNKTVTTTEYTEDTETTAYGYDEDNRLTAVSDINNAGKTNSYSFAYDYRTRRYYRATPAETNLCVFSDGLAVQEYDAAGTVSPLSGIFILTEPLAPANLSVENIRTAGYGGGVGGMVYSIKNGQLKASHSNHRGDVVAKTDSLGNLSWFARYNAYGTRFHEIGATHDRQRGNTKDEEEPLGLNNQGMRWLDLYHGVWLTLDPIGFADGPSRYLYVHCNPITGYDPLGLADINFYSRSGASEADVNVAREMLSNALERRNPDGSRPESVVRLEWLLSDDNEHDIDVFVGERGSGYKNYASAKNAVRAENGKGSGSDVGFDPNTKGVYAADKAKKDPESILVHEVAGHGYNNAKGTALTQSAQREEEKNATYIENTHLYAKGMGDQQRTKYQFYTEQLDVKTVPVTESTTEGQSTDAIKQIEPSATPTVEPVVEDE